MHDQSNILVQELENMMFLHVHSGIVTDCIIKSSLYTKSSKSGKEQVHVYNIGKSIQFERTHFGLVSFKK